MADQSDLKTNVLSAIKWSYVSQYLPLIGYFSSQIVLARLLDPSDYGIVGFCSSILGLSAMFQGGRGLSLALIRKQGSCDADCNHALTMNVTVGVVLYIGLIAASPLFTMWARDQRVVQVVLVQGLSIIFASGSAIYTARLQRDFRFKQIAIRTVARSLVPFLVAIPMAYKGYGFWSLVVSQVAGEIVSLIVLAWSTKWRPAFSFDVKAFMSFFRFGRWVLVEDIMGWLINYADNFLIARFFSMHDLGLYAFAKRLVSIGVGNIVAPIIPVLYSAFCKLRESKKSLVPAFLQANRLCAGAVLAATVGIAVLAPQAIHLLFGAKWAGASLIVSIYSLSEISYICTPSSQVLLATGFPSINTKFTFFSAIFLLLAYVISVPHGVHWFVFSRLTGSLSTPVIVALAAWKLDTSLSKTLSAFIAPVVASIVMAIAVLGCDAAFAMVHSSSVIWNSVVLISEILVAAVSFGATILALDRNLALEMVHLVQGALHLRKTAPEIA